MATIKRGRRTTDGNILQTLSSKSRIAIILLSIAILILSLSLPILLSTYSIATIKPSRNYKVGELSDETIYSPIDFSYIDEVATEGLYQEAANSVLPQFSYSSSKAVKLRSRASRFASIFEPNAPITSAEFFEKYGLVDSKDVVARLEAYSEEEALIIARLISECTTSIINIGLLNESDIEGVIEKGFDKVSLESSDKSFVLTRSIVDVDDLLTRENLSQYVFVWVSKIYSRARGYIIDLITDGVELLIEEDVSYDDILTQYLREEAKLNVAPVLIEIKEGDALLSQDKIVTEQMLRNIDEINSKATIRLNWKDLIGRVFYISTVIGIFLFIFFRSIQYKYRITSYTIIILVSMLIILTASFFWVSFLLDIGVENIDSFLPFYIIPMLAAAITNKRSTGLVTGVFFAALQNLWPTSNIYTFFYIVTCCIVSNYFIRFNNDRIQVILQSFESAGAVAGVTIIFMLLEQMSFISLLISVLGAVINVFVSHFLLAIILPVFERVFNIPTGYRLHELSYTGTPALTRLNQVAPGTYNHVKNVSEMAFAAAKAIDANAELARVGALYHDIGKSEHPEYFVENQTGKNAHDDISSTLSAAIIKSHVKIGVEKAKEIGLPQEVIDIIAEHHGNDLIKYFYNNAVKNNKLGSAVSEEDFRYSGRTPSTPESAIVMLSDCVEAATRTIKNPNHQKYEKFISSIVSDKINYRQLDNSQLTLTDLDIIKDTFIHELMGRDHHRIEYDNAN